MHSASVTTAEIAKLRLFASVRSEKRRSTPSPCRSRDNNPARLSDVRTASLDSALMR